MSDELNDNERARLEAAERVCAAFGWNRLRDETDIDAASTELWMRWAALDDANTGPQSWPDIDIAELAAERRATVQRTLDRIAESTP